MGTVEDEILSHLVARYLRGARLSPALEGQVLHIAEGRPAREVVERTGLSYHTVRCRRARLYRTLKVNGAGGVMAGLLAISLEILARQEGDVRTVA
jgi:DNA-binding CsgD family transcriptional regulator